jgi:hypothetical protein
MRRGAPLVRDEEAAVACTPHEVVATTGHKTGWSYPGTGG